MQLDKNLRQGHRLTLSQHFFPSCLHLLDAGSVGRSAYPSNIPAAIKLAEQNICWKTKHSSHKNCWLNIIQTKVLSVSILEQQNDFNRSNVKQQNVN